MREIKNLTLKEIKHRKGRPVWVETLGTEDVDDRYKNIKHWGIVIGDGICLLDDSWNLFIPFEDYNLFNAYENEIINKGDN